jgi:hypothetical protein
MTLNKEYFDAREQAMEWLAKDAHRRDFNEGVNILINSGFKTNVAVKLRHHGQQPWTVEKLHYCLREMIQMYYAPDDPKYEDVPDPDILNHESTATLTHEKSKSLIDQVTDKKKFESMPEIIQIIIRTFGDSYKRRAILHRKMSELDEDNTPELMRERAALSEQIDMLSELMDQLNKYKEAYDADGTLPNLDNVKSDISAADKKHETKSNKDVDAEAIAKMDAKQLQTRHHSIVNQITRKENQIKYQSMSKKEKENPMPDCPKKLKLEKQISNLQSELEKVDYALAKFA